MFDGVTAAGNEQHLVHFKLEEHVIKSSHYLLIRTLHTAA